MVKQQDPILDIGGIKVQIGPAISQDGGLVVVVRHIRESSWFPALVDGVQRAILASPRPQHGFHARAKLEGGLLALLAGLAMGRRNPNLVAQCFQQDPLSKAAIGRTFIQRELSRLMEVLGTLGENPLRRALLGSALAGQDHLELDMDSSVLELHGAQEWGSCNAHYQTFGYHAGWAFDVRTGKLAALWLNEGNANTARGQADQLTWILDQGVKVAMVRFDAGLINPEMLSALDGRVDRFACRIRSNPTLHKLANPLEPPAPMQAKARSYGEFRYAAGSWAKEHRVVVKFETPEGQAGEMALFAERFYFVTNLEDAPADIVRFYLDRGHAERLFGDFATTLRPTFRHAEVRKNRAWALRVALAHNVLADLRDRLPLAEKPAKQRAERRSPLLPEHWVFGFHRLVEGVTEKIRPLLARVRDLALRVPCEWREVGKGIVLWVRPDIQAPTWFPALARD